MNTATEYDKLTERELRDALAGFQLRVLRTAAMLSARCGDPLEASRHIRLAFDLPPAVAARQTALAIENANADCTPTVPEIAMLIARMTATVREIEATLTRRQAATLQ